VLVPHAGAGGGGPVRRNREEPRGSAPRTTATRTIDIAKKQRLLAQSAGVIGLSTRDGFMADSTTRCVRSYISRALGRGGSGSFRCPRRSARRRTICWRPAALQLHELSDNGALTAPLPVPIIEEHRRWSPPKPPRRLARPMTPTAEHLPWVAIDTPGISVRAGSMNDHQIASHRGRSPIPDWVSGATLRQVFNHASCSVLVMRAR
jgi:hypothetical protein